MSRLVFTVFLLFCYIYGSEGKSLLKHFRHQERFTCPGEGFYGIEGQCVPEYYICVSGVAYLQRCPGENVFDPASSRCVPLAEASCRNSPTSSPSTIPATASTTLSTARPTTIQETITQTTTKPTTIPSGGIQFDCPAEHGFYPFPNACTDEYIVCVSGSPYVTTCPNGAIFDPQSLICTPPDEASCMVFICPSPDGFFPMPGACSNNYYSCVGGDAYVQNCPGTAVFDPVSYVCVPVQSASCATTIPSTTTSTTSTTTTTTTTRPTTTTTIPTTTIAQTTTAGYKCPSTGNFPYEGSCSLYYVCSSNGYIIASCPPGEVFNPDIEFCEPPGNVAGCTFNLTAYLRHLRNAVAHRYECKVQTEAQQQR